MASWKMDLLCKHGPIPYLRAKVNENDLLRRPVPYECEITPRFPEAASLLTHELELYSL